MLVLPSELTHEHAAACCLMLQQGLRAAGETTAVADASALQRFDSSALAVLLDCRREALAMGRTFSVRGLPARLRELAGLYGVAELLPAAP
ncbi:MAG: STAS domain-containing protein [Burkholderiales bacterium]|nr:STAS domain-containing protein [Burkholderiales bacterium]